jgi:hypothetical protein
VIADDHREDVAQAATEDVLALVGIEQDTAPGERGGQLRRVIDGHQRVLEPAPEMDLHRDLARREAHAREYVG